MKIKPKKYNLELDQKDINILEGELFSIKMNYGGLSSTASQKKFEEENKYLLEFYNLISKFRNSDND